MTVQDSKDRRLVDLVDGQFTAPEPDQLWVGDITYIWTYSGFAYLATLSTCVEDAGGGP